MKLLDNEIEYEAVMQRIDELLETVDDNTPVTDKNYIELDILSDLVVAYEQEHYPVNKPTLTDIMKLRMFEMNLNQSGLAEMLGVSASRISEFMTGKSEPTLKVAREISRKLNIDPSIVLGV
jgi:HTH-type transcriptional regulator/antitoxin HigA